MKAITRQFLVLFGGLIGLFLVLEHFTGFSKDVGAIGSGLSGVAKTLQAR